MSPNTLIFRDFLSLNNINMKTYDNSNIKFNLNNLNNNNINAISYFNNPQYLKSMNVFMIIKMH